MSRLGRYEVLSELGKGAMGVVYLAKDPSIGRLVAIKTIRVAPPGEDDSESKEFRQRFTREAQTAGVLSHPNIVTIYDVGDDVESAVSFIAMEYIEGKSLKTLLAEKTEFAPDQVADIVGQVAEALDYAHRKGIIHRDIKPANIMITTDGKVKITDFGIAKVASSNLTTTGQFLGTPNYMSPEQVTGAPVDGRSDVFSLGVVLYEMLAKKKPFAGENLTTISYKIVHENFQPLGDVAGNVPEEFDRILARALAKDPWNRYQRGKDMALALYQAKARYEEQAMFQDLGTMVSSAENLPTLKLENLEEIKQQAAGLAAAEPPAAPAEVPLSMGTVEVKIPEEIVREPEPPAPPPPPLMEAKPSADLPAAPAIPDGTPAPEPPPVAALPPEPASASEPEAATPPPAAPAPSSVSVWRASVNPKYWWGIVAVAAVAAAAVYFVLRSRIPKVEERKAQVEANQAAVRLRQDLERGKALYNAGKYPESLDLFRAILQKDPSVQVARQYSQMSEEALAAQQAKKAEEEKTAQIVSRLQNARQALDEKNFESAISEADAVLDLDPANADAKNISEEGRRRLTAEKKAELKKSRDRKGKDQSLAGAGQPRANASSSPPSSATARPAVAANTPATIRLVFASPIAKGYLMVAINDTIIYRKNFDFGREKSGTISDVLHTAPGSTTVKVWLTTPDSSVKGYQPIPATLSPGDSRTLTLTLQGNRFSAALS
jgi:serine/threonine protein kinase